MLDDIWGDKFPYNARRFANLLKAFTNTLWRAMTSLIPKINAESMSKIVLVEEATKMWIRLFEEYREVNWRTKSFPFNERLKLYTDKIDEVKNILILFDEMKVIKSKMNLDIDLK
jgi:hypothetical protein